MLFRGWRISLRASFGRSPGNLLLALSTRQHPHVAELIHDRISSASRMNQERSPRQK